MPMITVDWLEGRSVEQRQALSRAITDAFVQIAKVPKEQVWIQFHDVPRSHWAMSGDVLDPGKKS